VTMTLQIRKASVGLWRILLQLLDNLLQWLALLLLAQPSPSTELSACIMANTYEAIATVEVGSGGAADIDF
jgi:hypothetical protein